MMNNKILKINNNLNILKTFLKNYHVLKQIKNNPCPKSSKKIKKIN